MTFSKRSRGDKTMLIERNRAGAWVVSDLIGGYLVTHIYYEFTKREAVAAFRKETKGARRWKPSTL